MTEPKLDPLVRYSWMADLHRGPNWFERLEFRSGRTCENWTEYPAWAGQFPREAFDQRMRQAVQQWGMVTIGESVASEVKTWPPSGPAPIEAEQNKAISVAQGLWEQAGELHWRALETLKSEVETTWALAEERGKVLAETTEELKRVRLDLEHSIQGTTAEYQELVARGGKLKVWQDWAQGLIDPGNQPDGGPMGDDFARQCIADEIRMLRPIARRLSNALEGLGDATREVPAALLEVNNPLVEALRTFVATIDPEKDTAEEVRARLLNIIAPG